MVWRYQRGHQKLQIDGRTTQWSKEKKDKRSNNDLQNITQEIKDRTTRTPLITGGEVRCSGRTSSSCPGVKSGALEGLATPVPHIAPVLLLLPQTRRQVMNEERTVITTDIKKGIFKLYSPASHAILLWVESRLVLNTVGVNNENLNDCYPYGYE
jgi:hypothetical protein